MERILIVEDDLRIATFLEKGLHANGFMPKIVNNGENALTLALSERFDLIVLDLGLPFESGFEILDKLRGQGVSIPVIILTARSKIDDKVAGFERGADDYLTKPFQFEELVARIRARLRKPLTYDNSLEASEILALGPIELNLHTRRAKVHDGVVNLSAREFNLVETLIRHKGKVLSREQLLDRVWGYTHNPGSNIVDVYIGYLRKKIGSDLIETVRGVGYRIRLE
ncbi:MAG: response regulator transcription factor [Cyanobacteria bacterium P01_F01_bin.86]